MTIGAEDVASVVAQVKSMELSEENKKKYGDILEMINEVPKFGNDDPEVDAFARDVAYTYTKPLLKYHNPRGGQFQAGLYPVSANVPLGAQTGATPDGQSGSYPCGRRCISFRRKGCEGTYRSGQLCSKTGSRHCIQRYLV